MIKQKDIISNYKDEFYYLFEINVVFGGKERKLLSSLVKELGVEKAHLLIMTTTNKWSFVKDKKRGLKGLPSMGFIYGFRYYLLDILKDKMKEGIKDDPSDDRHIGGSEEAEAYLKS